MLGYIMYPFDLLFKFTIPNSDDESFDTIFSPLSIIGSLLWVCIYGGISSWSCKNIILICSAVISSVIAMLAFIMKEGLRKLQIVFSASSFVMSIFWTWLIMNHVVSIIKLLAEISGIGQYVMGVLLIGVGNCIPDMFANNSLVKLGLSKMAISGCMSSPLFNTLIGLSSTFVIAIATKYADN
jgi:Ca2+/Na+ antiporter